MADQTRDIQSILAALSAAQRGPSTTPSQGQQGVPPGYPPPPGAPAAPAPYSSGPPPQQYPPPNGPASYGLPQPSGSGSVDLSSIRPVNSGTVGFEDAIAKAKAFAAQNGLSSYDRPIVYSNEPPRGPDPRNAYRSSRSRSPPSRRDPYRGHVNPYRDERREDRGHGRDYGGGGGGGGGRDRSYSPNPRGRTFSPRNTRDRSPIRNNGGGGGAGADDSSETIQIESSLVGLIIGRQGENLRRIEGETGCRVQFMPATDNGPYRSCKISGPAARRADVKVAVNRIIEDSGMSVINRGGALNAHGDQRAPASAGLRDGEDCMQIMVPDRTVGLIIGRGGETIRDLQERSGCHINITSENKSVNGLRPVNLIGTRETAARAKDFIMEIVESDSRGDGQPPPPVAKRGPPPPRQDQPRDSYGGGGGVGGGDGDKINDTIHVPSEAVGMIIGRGGETIREMQNSTGCKINVAQSSGPGEVQREIALIGSRDSISRAKAAIEEKVDAVVSPSSKLEHIRKQVNSFQRQKSGGGGGGGGGGGRGRRDDYDNYSHQASNSAGQASAPAAQPPATADGADPYAMYGGYQNYLALWYQSLMQQGAGGQPPAAGGAPPPAA
ncbi:KH domain-containing protein [Plectosphaerella plurivora]|uniref:KH domain-containing protein n=1 Tax=Plectosphaerella plurivora TaxID=936078 RepID=A0A9P9A970_9PEZI|nr:KH domain-containing protein [Plectosphaerella plurivora]